MEGDENGWDGMCRGSLANLDFLATVDDERDKNRSGSVILDVPRVQLFTDDVLCL
jgi:hypothetical protein